MFIFVKGTLTEQLLSVPSYFNLNYWWNFGSLLGFILVLQIVTGLVLTFYYSPDSVFSFLSIEGMERSVQGFANFRVLHVMGVNMFFVFIYLHMMRGMFLGSFRMMEVWVSGVTIFLVLMAVAFFGYVLPWGQMSLWGATVITNLVSVVPFVGKSLLLWLWWGYSVNMLTLKLFFSLHFLLPFVIVVLVVLHLINLHFSGSSNVVLNLSGNFKKSFDPFFTMKDIVLVFLFLVLLLFNKDVLLDPENYLEANSMMSPIHIKPEWYFLFVYAILRSIPNKSLGVVALVASLLVLYVLSLSEKSVVFLNKDFLFWFFVCFMLLTWVGGNAVEFPFINFGQFLTFLYFVLFYLCMVWYTCLNKLVF